MKEFLQSKEADDGKRSAGFQTCGIADFQVGRACEFGQRAGLKTRDTAGLEARATILCVKPT